MCAKVLHNAIGDILVQIGHCGSAAEFWEMNLITLVSVLFVCILLALLNSWLIWDMTEVHSSHRNVMSQINNSILSVSVRARAKIRREEASHRDNERKHVHPNHIPDVKPPLILETQEQSHTVAQSVSTKRAIIFTMDSISSYELNSRKGGAAGELLIRHSLEGALRELGINVRVVTSDEEFLQADLAHFDIVIVDPWTWAAKGWVPKPVLLGHQHKVFVLDFFGSQKLLNSKSSFDIPPKRLLTAFGSPWNTFLGYSMEKVMPAPDRVLKKNQGVIWGKDPKHFEGRKSVLMAIADKVQLHSTASRPVFRHSNVKWDGHQTPEGWKQILSESKFLIGLGDPLLGPSAIDAISVGCMYINPVYASPVRDIHKTQHDYASQVIGPPYVCNADLGDISSVMTCVNQALSIELQPFIPPDFLHHSYMDRVRSIFL